MNLPRGIRNKNPGNIDFNKANNWVGQLGIEPGANGRFAVFDTHENGIRALGKLLQTYYTKHKRLTIKDILVRYAPDFENDTSAYIRSVAAQTGLGATETIKNIKDPKILGALMKAIIRHENANYAYPDDIFNEGLRRAVA